MKEVLNGWDGGVLIGGKKISNLCYADDTVLVASSEEELMQIMQSVNASK